MVAVGKLWGDAEFALRSPFSKLIYVYLISQPSITALGVVKLQEEKIAFDLKIDLNDVAEALEELETFGFLNVRIKESAYETFIIKAHFDSLPKSAVQMKRAREEGKTSTYRKQLLKIYDKDDFEQKTKFVPPTPEQVSKYALDLGFLVDGKVFVDYYGDNDWYNRNGKKVRNWQATCKRVWCREEDRIDFPDNAPKGAERFYITSEEGRIIVAEGWRNGQPTHSNFLYAEQLKEEYAKIYS